MPYDFTQRVATLTHTVGAREVRNYVDLHVGRLQVAVNHSAGTAEFTFPVKNLGDLPAKGPFSIVVGVSYQLHNGSVDTIPQSYTQEAVLTFNKYDEIPGNSTYMTLPITTLLGYINISSANKYTVEIIVDPEMQLDERYLYNNRTTITWFTNLPPVAAPGADPDRATVAILSRQTIDSKEVSSEAFAEILANANDTTFS